MLRRQKNAAMKDTRLLQVCLDASTHLAPHGRVPASSGQLSVLRTQNDRLNPWRNARFLQQFVAGDDRRRVELGLRVVRQQSVCQAHTRQSALLDTQMGPAR